MSEFVGNLSEPDFTMKKRQILTEFIQLYASYPCLWNVKSRQYHNQTLRGHAYKVLAQKLQMIHPGADRPTVVRKINCLRSNVRKERHKTQKSLSAGIFYKTKLWYYNLFDFLDQMGERKSADTTMIQVAIKTEEDKSSDLLNVSTSNEVVDETYQNENSSSCTEIQVTESEPVGNVWGIPQHDSTSHFSNVNFNETLNERYDRVQDDRHDAFGRNVTMKLRHLSTMNDSQRIMAEKIINEALYMAEMGLLTLEHVGVLKTSQ